MRSTFNNLSKICSSLSRHQVPSSIWHSSNVSINRSFRYFSTSTTTPFKVTGTVYTQKNNTTEATETSTSTTNPSSNEPVQDDDVLDLYKNDQYSDEFNSDVETPDPEPTPSQFGIRNIKKILHVPDLVPPELMAPYRTGLFDDDQYGQNCILQSVIKNNLASLTMALQELHHHVNEISTQLLSDPKYAEFEYKDSIFAANSTHENPSFAYRYMISKFNEDNVSPLLFAIAEDMPLFRDMLIEAGASLDSEYDNGVYQTLLLLASEIGQIDTMKVLIEAGADFHLGKKKSCLLQSVIYNNQPEIAQMMFDRNIDLNRIKKILKYEVAGLPIAYNNFEITKMFLDHYCKMAKPDFVPFEIDCKDNSHSPKASMFSKLMYGYEKEENAYINLKHPDIPDIRPFININILLEIAMEEDGENRRDVIVLLGKYGALNTIYVDDNVEVVIPPELDPDTYYGKGTYNPIPSQQSTDVDDMFKSTFSASVSTSDGYLTIDKSDISKTMEELITADINTPNTPNTASPNTTATQTNNPNTIGNKKKKNSKKKKTKATQ